MIIDYGNIDEIEDPRYREACRLYQKYQEHASSENEMICRNPKISIEYIRSYLDPEPLYFIVYTGANINDMYDYSRILIKEPKYFGDDNLANLTKEDIDLMMTIFSNGAWELLLEYINYYHEDIEGWEILTIENTPIPDYHKLIGG